MLPTKKMEKNSISPTYKYHTPVMTSEVLSFLEPGRKFNIIDNRSPMFIDGTVGDGGHAQLILENLSQGIVVGLDWDADAVEHTRIRLKDFSNFHLFHTSYTNIDKVAAEFPNHYLQGVLLDLGVSLYQITAPGRGFTYSAEGPLDMRYNQTIPARIAKDIIKQSALDELTKIFIEFGEDRYARKIARHIHDKRWKINNTTQLADAIKEIIPLKNQNKTLSRIFQALRIAVNNELANIKTGLEKAIDLLSSGARIVVIAYHSLEDRIVKQTFRDYAGSNILKILTKKPLRPQFSEVSINQSARSARLRAAEKN
jgi:16S rRNA (cytosine1402-N4)-methyltransferase